jgi:hypothetical protein
MKHKVLVLAIAAAAAAVQAQERTPAETARLNLLELQAAVAMPRLAVESTVTKGAPYSAEAVTEFQQVLSDGNRISRRTVVRIYRDSEGRTRREQTNRSADGKESVSISIVDPVAQASFTLDPESRTAYRSGAVIAGPAIVPPSGMGSGAQGGRGGGGGGGGPSLRLRRLLQHRLRRRLRRRKPNRALRPQPFRPNCQGLPQGRQTPSTRRSLVNGSWKA